MGSTVAAAGGKARILFTDIDGTLVHYLKHLSHLGSLSEAPTGSGSFTYKDGTVVDGILQLPPSLTGAVAFISKRTLELAKGVRGSSPRNFLVLVSGARTSTILQRLPWLPAADAFVTENGGRIFLRDPEGAWLRLPSASSFRGLLSSPGGSINARAELAAAPYVEDLSWRSVHAAAAGPASQEQLKPEERSGPLWDVFRQLQGAGWAPDAGSYTTLVRVKRVQPGKTAEEWLRLRASFHASLQSADNLDYTDIFPASSGKDAAARHLAAVHGCALADCVSMGDDDNDLGIAAAVGHAFVPGITAESMREAIAADPARFTLAPLGGFAGTESSLEAIQALFSR